MWIDKIYIAIATLVVPIFNIVSLKLIATTFQASATTAFILITASANIFAILIAFGNSNVVQINWEQLKHGSNSVLGAILLLAFFIASLGALLAQYGHEYLMLSILIGFYFAIIAVMKSIFQMQSAGFYYLAITICQVVPFFVALIFQYNAEASFAEFAQVYFVLVMTFAGFLLIIFAVGDSAQKVFHFRDIQKNLKMGSGFVVLSFQAILINQFDRFLIPHLGLESGLLPYVVTAQFLSPISLLVAIIVNSNIAKVYRAYDQKDKEKVVGSIAFMYLFYASLCIVYFIFFATFDVQKFFYPDIDVSIGLSSVLAIALFLLGTTSINNLVVYKENRQTELAVWLFVCSLSAVSVGYFFGYHFGLLGVAAGVAIGYFLYFSFGMRVLFLYWTSR